MAWKSVRWLTVILLCVTSISAQSRRKQSPFIPSQPTYIDLPGELLQQLVRDDRDVRNFIENVGQDYINENKFSAAPVELNGDRTPEFIVYPPTLMDGNSSGPRWVYRRTANGYEQLLSTGAMMVELLRTSTKGYRDLVSSGGGNAMGYFKNVFKFNGRKYILFSKRTNKNRIPN
jgi:hypothetical protein